MRTLFTIVLAVFLAIIVLSDGRAQGFRPEGKARQWLVTPEEAARKAPPTRVVQPSRSDPGGPRMVVKSPGDIKEIRSPVTIDVAFAPQDGASVDLSSLKVTYIALIDIDITRRLAPYLAESGIHADAADLPTGSHDIEISLRDSKGRRSVERLSFKVVD